MQLYFLRHGLADWPNWDAARDDERPLTDAGAAKMKAEAKTIQRLDLKLDAILSSPLVRAWQTAEAVAKRLNLEVNGEPALAPGFDVKRLRAIVRRHAQADALMLVGHEPDFSGTIAHLIGGGRVVLKKGGVARVDLDSLDPLSGALVWLLAPKTLIGD
ncbi:MAG TPA: phosphohistidine phosphatase SixA [Anaerolineae bacterium]|nr:phosphohistidine phosphatase SixA [Anaerolineae bacterium]